LCLTAILTDISHIANKIIQSPLFLDVSSHRGVPIARNFNPQSALPRALWLSKAEISVSFATVHPPSARRRAWRPLGFHGS